MLNSYLNQPDPIDSREIGDVDRLFNDSRYCVNSSKLEELGWRQETTFEEGLIKTIEYYKEKI